MSLLKVLAVAIGIPVVFVGAFVAGLEPWDVPFWVGLAVVVGAGAWIYERSKTQ